MRLNIFKLLGVIFILNAFAGKAQLKFTTLDSLPAKLIFHSYASDGENFYAFNGTYLGKKHTKLSSKIYKFDVKLSKWSEVNVMKGRIQATSAYLPATGKIYTFGGGRNHKFEDLFEHVEAFDVKTGKTNKLKSSIPYPMMYGGSAAWQNKIYIFGGTTYGAVTSSKLYEFDAENNSFTELPNMPEAKQVAGEIVDGVLYTFGGYNEKTKTASDRIDAYDISSKTWKHIGSLPGPVSANAVAVHGKRIYLAGNFKNGSFLGYFDTTTKEFTRLTSDMVARRHAGIAILDNKLYVFGGNTTKGVPFLNSTQVAQLEH